MTDRDDRRLIVIWAILIGITTFSWDSGWIQSPNIRAAIVLILALVKVRVILRDFMEVRHAPLPLRIALQAWLVAIGGAMIGLTFYTA